MPRSEGEVDLVNSPPHYTQGSIEPIVVIEDWQLDFCLGNCVKYVARAAHKGTELLDLKKAAWYLQRRIEQVEKGLAQKPVEREAVA